MEKDHCSPFIDKLQRELLRAERYRIFISLTVVDFSSIKKYINSNEQKRFDKILNIVRDNIRNIDCASFVTDDQIGLLFPETSRQGAEIVARRIVEIIKESFADIPGLKQAKEVIPMEMASYPDTGGTKPIKDYMEEWLQKSTN